MTSRSQRTVVVAVIGAAFGLWLGGELYDGLIPPATEPTLGDRLPWLTHPLLGPLIFAVASVLLLRLVESVVSRTRSRG